MITKRVNRYYCEYCKKANCCAPAMKRHEERCTLNPHRKCGMCKLMDKEQPPMAFLLTVVNAFNIREEEITGPGINGNITWKEWVIPKSFTEDLERAAEGCPACMLAAIRQSKIPVGCVTGFSFTDMCKSVWADYNDARSGGYE
jgi:hypothetical protein